ncbi:hypothetical protein ACIPIA_14740, partial [Bosea sp. CER48]|uniref:hypothetical protein n=1 Tax=Bosea sp. CER48 TaxID=3377035 RepID=UPI0037FD78BD
MPPASQPSQHKGPFKRIALGVVRAVLTAFIILDEIARPLYRPLIRWFASLRLVHHLEAAVARLPRPLVLLAFAVPFIIAEPLKLLGLILMARGTFWTGLIVLGLAHLATFLIVERIYDAGRDKLMSYRWFAWGIGIVTRLRDQALGWVRASSA